jgi:hypothetical protein
MIDILYVWQHDVDNVGGDDDYDSDDDSDDDVGGGDDDDDVGMQLRCYSRASGALTFSTTCLPVAAAVSIVSFHVWC